MFRRDEPLPVLGVSPRDAPSCIFEINSEWAVYLIGLCEFMLWPDFWDEATGDVDQAIADASNLIALLAECAEMLQVGQVSYRLAPGVHGGAATPNAWNVRLVNTVDYPQSWLSINNNKLVLLPGLYRIEAVFASIACGWSRFRLRDYVLGVQLAISPACFFGVDPEYADTLGCFDEVVSLIDTTELEFSQWCTAHLSNYDLGYGLNLAGQYEIHTVVTITRLG